MDGVAMGKLHRRKDSEGWFGRAEEGSLRHTWYLIGRRGAVQFVAKEYLPGTPVHETFATFAYLVLPVADDGAIWDGIDVGYHSPAPMHGGEAPMGSCPVLEGNCFYDGSGLQADQLCRRWAAAHYDDEIIWDHLEGFYARTFESRRRG